MNPDLNPNWANIRLLVLDVDGVMTDGQIHLDGTREIKVFDVQDGLGLALLKRSSIQIAIITGRHSEAVDQRARELGIDLLYQGVLDKGATCAAILERNGLTYAQVCAMGDDLPDLPLIRRSGVGVAVANACEALKAEADWVTRQSGGRGAVREVCEAILKAQGRWESLIKSYED